jgi:hypothetical protein
MNRKSQSAKAQTIPFQKKEGGNSKPKTLQQKMRQE